jgi:CcmD family protein
VNLVKKKTMRHLKFPRLVMVLLAGVALAVLLAGGAAFAQQPPPAAAQDGYVPVKSLPAGQVQEGIPAAPLVVGAYAFVWAVLIVYLWSIWRRLGKVEQEIGALERRVRKSSSAARP